MTSAEIRQSFLDFFREKQHTVVPSSSLLPDAPNLLFTNAGMNQFVPIFLGQQTAPWNPARTADTQKCIRAGGKHNDLDDVGLDTYHHTFFEMLGNWSFGDYFKREAIEWAWELVVERWGLPPRRLYATVYKPGAGEPSEFDQEAHDHWARLFQKAALDPAVHVVNGNKKDNFWMMGDTGPCGPCSELHVDLTPAGDTRGELVNAGDARCMEIWNLVFIQFNANADGTFVPLPQRHVDTGMGFERVCSIIQGTKQFTDFTATVSNYETDVFRPIFDEIEKLSGRRYTSTLPQPGSTGDSGQEKIDIAFRVIGDHIRTLSFAIADGIQPSNEGRGYVLRRILRRAVRYGRTLGFQEPFFYRLVDVLVATMSGVFPELKAKQQLVRDTLRREEEAFNKTLDKGIALFEAEVAQLPSGSAIRGDFAFRLYDEQGFPLDLTELMARERGFSVDVAGFKRLMEQQRTRARAAQKKETISVSEADGGSATAFVGYEQREAVGRVVSSLAVKEKLAVVLDTTACYAEMGGQVGDTGELTHNGSTWRIANTQKAGGAVVHLLAGSDAPAVGTEVRVQVDVPRRSAIERHHTVTHLLHWALHEVVSRDAAQKGSYVGPEKLTFDFNSAALTPQQISDVERLVNERIVENGSVSWLEVPLTEVKQRPDIIQFFGEKYGDIVRVVQIGGSPRELNGYSMELCGGTHVRGTGEIGLFRIVAESAIAAGVRRIEAVAGLQAYDSARRDMELIRSLASKLNSPVVDLEKRLEALLAQQKALEKSMRALEQKQAGETAKQLIAKVQAIGSTPAIVENLGTASGDQLQAIADGLKQQQFGGVVVLAGTSDGSVSLVATVAPELTSRLQAGKIIQSIAPFVGGKGGGRADAARGAGKEASKIDAALAQARELITAAGK